jgi:PKD repeat protein
MVYQRQGSTVTIYQNGISLGNFISSTSYTFSGGAIGSLRNYEFERWVGYMDDLRVTKGVARYTANFTPPTQAFPDSGPAPAPTDPYYSSTRAILNFQGANGSTTWTNEADNLSWGPYTSVGTPQISTSQFIYGSSSMRVNGGANRIQLANEETSGFSSSWTLEGWFRSDEESYTGSSYPQYRGVMLVTNSGGMDRACSLGFYNQSVTYRPVYGAVDGGAIAIRNDSYNILANTWYYYCISSSLSTKTVTLYMAPFGSTAVSTVGTYTPNNGNMMALLFKSIGGSQRNNEGLAGYIGPTRLTVGVARTPAIPTGLFPSPTTAPNISVDPFFLDVSLLLHFNGQADSTIISDSSMVPATVSVLGGAKISTTQKKFGSGSLNLSDGTSSVSVATTPALGFGTGDFTIEAFIYPTSIRFGNIYSQRNSATNGITFRTRSDGKLEAFYGGGNGAFTTTNSYLTNAWQHVALVRKNNVLTIYINGVSSGSGSWGLVDMSVGEARVGQDASNYGEYFAGFIDEVRVTKGVARYSENFVPTDVEFSNVTTPSATFTSDKTNGPVPTTVNFTDLSLGAPTSWLWDFKGDGTAISTLQNPSFTYTDAGEYSVKLTATNSLGSNTITLPNYVYVGTGDVHYNSVTLLLHLNGADGASVFTDNSKTPKLISSSGSVSTRSTQKKFGNSSAYFSGGYISAGSSTSFGFTANQQFTVEAWVYPGPNSITSPNKGLFSMRIAGIYCPFELRLNGTSLTWLVADSNLGNWAAISTLSGVNLVQNSWNHVALVGNGTTLNVYVNGIASSTTATQAAWPVTARTLYFGAGGDGQLVDTYLDEIRVTTGVARYSNNFTPPTAPFLDFGSDLVVSRQEFNYTGAAQDFIVPAGVNTITAKMWGGAGGGQQAANTAGAGGGYSTASIPVTPGESLTIYAGGGGAGGIGGRIGCNGGGSSAITRGAAPLIIAGGGGGASSRAGSGAGGGLAGLAGTSPSTNATGGTQSAAGAGGIGGRMSGFAGSGYNGGDGSQTAGYPVAATWGHGLGGRGGNHPGDCGGGGGGGGYYGGGGGGNDGSGDSGAGGSGFVPAGGTTTAGSGSTPGNAGDPDRGTAGQGNAGQAGGHGKVIISW